MCVKPEPRIYSCPACGWWKVVAPKSDVLTPHDIFQSCPKCNAPLTHKTLPFKLPLLLEKILERI